MNKVDKIMQAHAEAKDLMREDICDDLTYEQAFAITWAALKAEKEPEEPRVPVSAIIR
tara:strand:- start:546 stop:719 length:174 start_codon:yes stop_codon:yes gene_type:complete